MSPTATMINHHTGETALPPLGQGEVLTLPADPSAAAVHLEALLRNRVLPQAG